MMQELKSGQQTREYIKQTFLSIYKNKPLHQIFVSDLVKACNISRGTFYFYYGNIETLYHECEQDIIDEMETDLGQVVLCTVGTDPEEYTRVYARQLESYKNNLDTYKCLLLGSEEASFRNLWFESIRRNYERAMSFSRDTTPEQRKNLARFFAGGVLAILSNWILNDCKEPAEEIAYISTRAQFQGTFQ